MTLRTVAIIAVLVGIASATTLALLSPRRQAASPGPPPLQAAPPTAAQPPAAPAAPSQMEARLPAAPPRSGAPAKPNPRAAKPAAKPKPKPAPPVAAAFDWPQWRGRERNGISRETGLLKSWPATGPPLLWKSSGLGGGYSAPSIAGGRIYGMGYRGEEEVVWALDEQTGKEVWSTPIVAANRQVGYNEGSRCTTTVDGDRLYALGVGGDLVCLDRASGKPRWQKNFVSEFGGRIPNWGYSESPLVDGEKLIATPGGPEATIVALNKLTGEVIWKARVPEGDSAHYASCIAADVNGQREYIQFLSGGLVGILASDGKFLWKYNRHANLTANIDTPIFRDNCVLISAGYGSGAGLVRLQPAAGGVTATEVYFNPDLKSKHGGMVLVGDYVYGFDDPGTLTCMEFKTGKTVWRDRSVGGNASVTYADGHLYCRSQMGPVALVTATPAGYQENGRFDQPDRSSASSWSHPVICHGRLYLRDQDVMLCYDVKQK